MLTPFLTGAVKLDPNLPWYIARSAGIVAWALVTASVLWGISVSGRLTKKRPPAAWMLDLHKFLGGLAIVFTFLHIIGLELDKYVNFGWVQILVPLQSSWKNNAVAVGVVAFWFLLAVEVTSYLMDILPRKVWHGVHLTSYLIFIFVTIHALTTGTDASKPLFRYPVLASLAVAAGIVELRIALPKARRTARDSATARHRRMSGVPADAAGAAEPAAAPAVTPAERVAAARAARAARDGAAVPAAAAPAQAPPGPASGDDLFAPPGSADPWAAQDATLPVRAAAPAVYAQEPAPVAAAAAVPALPPQPGLPAPPAPPAGPGTD